MAMKFYNTLTRQTDAFQPIAADKVRLYSCGPTVYNYAHIGNFRSFVFVDLLRRALKYCGYSVEHVINITDVDDKTIRDSKAAGETLEAFTERYTQYFFEDLATLRCEKAERYPRATLHVDQMIRMIQTLVEKGHAYQGEDGSVYFKIGSFDAYGKLARIDRSGQRDGVRISADEYGKENVGDFALWKAWTDDDGLVKWDSPWGVGRPGWHIECSAMSTAYLGAHFDIHTGGIDLMFPHHEDEIAQSECCTGEPFVNYWLHCEHLMVDGQKMSKSLGNFYTLRDILQMGYTGREIRYVLLAAHYRTKLNFKTQGTDGEPSALDQARASLKRVDDFIRRLGEVTGDPRQAEITTTVAGERVQELVDGSAAAFRAAVANDLDVPGCLVVLFDFVREGNRLLDQGVLTVPMATQLRALLTQFDQVLDVIRPEGAADATPQDVLDRVEARQAARKARDFAQADAIRDALAADGWIIEDTPKGPRVYRG